MNQAHQEPPPSAIDDRFALEETLHDALGRATMDAPSRLRSAMEHAVFPGGSRLRARLCLAVASACRRGPLRPRAFGAAAAVEFMHCASLVHDDLPCFDDAELRRGRPSVQRAFGEAMAVLVGDGLIVLAFDTLSRALATEQTFDTASLHALSEAAGACRGLVAGQAWELEGGSVDVLRYHRAKTASLFELASVLGARAAGGDVKAFALFGREIGMAYQAVDDLADRLGTPELLGKPVGQDAARGRPTSAGDLSVARLGVRLAAGRAMGAVPSCPGADGLRAMVETVMRALGLDLPLRAPTVARAGA